MTFDFIHRRKSSLLLGLFALCFALGANPVAEQPAPPLGVTFDAKVVRVIDGDTMEVEVTRKVTIRVIDCWCPELHPKTGTPVERQAESLKGFAAKAAMEELVQGRSVKVYVPVEGDKIGDAFSFGRALGKVWRSDGKYLAQEMIRAGHATATKKP